MRPYESVILLGSLCQVAFQLKEHDIKYVDGPFEWTVTTLESVLKILRDEGRSFAKNVTVTPDAQSVSCNQYGMLYHHDFPRGSGPKPLVEPITPEAQAEVASKFAHKMRSFTEKSRSTGRKVFIRLGGEATQLRAWPYNTDPTPTKISRLNELASSLESFCGNDNFDLALLYFPNYTRIVRDAELDPKVRLFPLPHPEGSNYRGYPAAWRPVLVELGLVNT
ncbi:hypothetical protein IFT59_21945 [Rhizobium sp. CFBP 8752]|uniref:DUF1796 family putative cysteine peptidase n=1 Tax=Rhizobium sp. CFBP 8752 TaxID=2775301 RepID=UPI00178050A1|nr:DUF1796 family putative cysteine peptidase [Rhizobium sp. CFBP 8752]MBD8665910.1 hypothetical protein [Rhizobium sp. CFBP 8752]